MGMMICNKSRNGKCIHADKSILAEHCPYAVEHEEGDDCGETCAWDGHCVPVPEPIKKTCDNCDTWDCCDELGCQVRFKRKQLVTEPIEDGGQRMKILARLKRVGGYDYKTEVDQIYYTMPKIVCLCGSTRFGKEFDNANYRETMAGNIVLTIGCNMKSDTELFGHLSEVELKEIKTKLDELHKRKIDLADEVLILNVGNYIGESTQSELYYAHDKHKVIRFLQSSDALAKTRNDVYLEEI